MLKSLVVLGGVVLGQAEAGAAGQDWAAQVRRLVEQLDAPQLNLRDAAEAALVKLGPSVLQHLPQHADPARPEVEVRLARIRLRLQQAQAEAAIEPSRVTLRAEGMPLSKLLAALEQQTGNKIVDTRRQPVGQAPDPPLKVDFDSTPFWPALDQVLQQTGLTMYLFGQQKAVCLVEPTGGEPSGTRWVSYSGPFRFEAVGLVAERDLREPARGALKLELEVAWEPRLEPITLQQRLADLRVEDENGRPLMVLTPEAELEVPVERGPVAKRLVIPLALPPRELNKIGRIEGALSALVPGRLETFRFSGLPSAKNAKQRIAGASVVVQQARQADRLWQIDLLVRFDRAEGALASHRNWILNNPAFLQDRDGKTIPYAASQITRQGPSEIGLSYQFAAEGPLEDYTLVYQTPAIIFSKVFAFRFKDIPLP